MPQAESYQGISRPGDNTGVGTTFFNADSTGVVAYAPTHFKQDGNLVHEKLVLRETILAAIVDNHMFTPAEGTWQVASASYRSRVAGTGGACTLDLKVCGAAVAPASGVTQLDAPFDLVTLADALDTSVIITSPTEIGPGSSLAMDVTGTATSVVGSLTVELKRIR